MTTVFYHGRIRHGLGQFLFKIVVKDFLAISTSWCEHTKDIAINLFACTWNVTVLQQIETVKRHQVNLALSNVQTRKKCKGGNFLNASPFNVSGQTRYVH